MYLVLHGRHPCTNELIRWYGWERLVCSTSLCDCFKHKQPPLLVSLHSLPTRSNDDHCSQLQVCREGKHTLPYMVVDSLHTPARPCSGHLLVCVSPVFHASESRPWNQLYYVNLDARGFRISDMVVSCSSPLFAAFRGEDPNINSTHR